MRVTRGRIAVFDALVSLGGHRSAHQVHSALVDRGHRLSRTSVYSALEVLARAGLVMAADAGPGRALYEAGGRWHHHAVCRRCGTVSDIECVVGAKPCLEAGEGWGEVDEAQVIFRGECRRCSSRPQGKKRKRGENS
jgi:Fur family ferric uptake transcriptional regulator